MPCRSCGSPNPPGQRFCGACGASLASGCPQCGAENPPGQRFCGNCGAQQPAAPTDDATAIPSDGSTSPGGNAGPVAERRLVTILFTDLVGFTTYAEDRDAEEVRETLGRYFELASELTGRYGGTIEKFIGDAVMAVWGTPVARENDAERAVRAALELVEAAATVGPGIMARAGVLTGEAAVTLGALNQGMVAGDLVNTAARLQGVAAPGTVLVGESTYRMASSAIAFEPLGSQSLKGKIAPVPSWRALRVVAERGGRGRSDVLEAPFVGRDEKVRQLKDQFHATAREQKSRMVSVSGIAGIGKSRLAWEFEKYLDGIVEPIWWHHGRSPAYGDGVTFWPLGEMIRARAGLAETDDEATTRTKLAALVARFGFEGRDRDWIEGSLLALLGVERAAASVQLFGAWRTFFERLAQDGTVVLVFEDLHWADSGTLEFIDHMLDWSRNVPIMIFTLARPELLERRPDWGAARRTFTSISLEPLSPDAMRSLLTGLIPGLPDAAVRSIVARAEGIPLYAVETVRMLVAEGRLTPREDGTYEPAGDLETLAVPETLMALIAARLDALDPSDRSLVLDAAVLGQSFTPAGLAAISGVDVEAIEPRLMGLVRRELLAHDADPRSPERGQYQFVQALIREVAYNTLARRDRKTRHVAAARFFEGLGGDEMAGALAGHYLAARENAADGEEAAALGAQARLALRGAADRAIALGAHDQAIGFLTQAMSVTSDPAEAAALLERAGSSASISANHEAADSLLRRAMAQYEEVGDLDGLVRAATTLGQELLNRYYVEPAIALIEDVLGRATDAVDEPNLIALRGQLPRAYYLHDEPRRAIETADSVLEAAERLDLGGIVAEVLVARGGALGDLGRTHEGLAAIEGGLRLAERLHLPLVVLRARNAMGVYLGQRDPTRAVAHYREGVAEARRIGARSMMFRLLTNAMEVTRWTGDWAWTLQESEEMHSVELEPEDRAFFLGQEAMLRAWRGEPVEDLMDELDRLTRDHPDPNYRLALTGTECEVALADGRLADARRLFRTVGEMSPVNAPTAFAAAGRAAIWQRDADGARADLEALNATGAHGDALSASRQVLRAGLSGLAGDEPTALAGYRDALEAWRELELPVLIAFTGIDIATVLGPGHAEVLEAAATAREILVRLRARPFIERLDAALGPDVVIEIAGLATAAPAGS